MEFLKLKKIHNREISDFAANLLLFEYARDTLDVERKIAVGRALEASPELQNEFIRLINGIQYCEKLSETLVNDAAIKQIEQQSSQVNFIVDSLRWHQWPLGFKWLLEAGVVAFLLVLVLNILPLNRVIHLNSGVDSQTIIAEVERKKKTDTSDMPEANKENPAFFDEEIKQKQTESVAIPPTAVAISLPTKLPSVSQDHLEPGSGVAPTVTTKTVAAKMAGWIYRGQFLVTNAEMVSPKLKDKILELGGQKAGEVEVGWMKAPNIYYFHFTVPEAKLAELEALLKDYSTGKIAKEAHPRVMPDGIIRLLFTVEEKATDNK